MKLFKIPQFVKWVYPKRIWGISVSDPIVFLTFDDGPIPEITPWILDFLLAKNIKATFFCVAENVLKYPEIYQRILDEGHSVGNHSFNHNNGYKTDYNSYITSFQKADSIIKSKLYRPPYGKMTRKQEKEIVKTHKIIMWSWLSYDFDKSVSTQKIMKNANREIKPGTILVLHDNAKIVERTKLLLPQIVELLDRKGLKFDVLK